MAKKKASPDRSEIRRVLLPLSPSAVNVEVLRTVAHVAGRLQAEMLGLFLKDESVLRGAAHSFADEVRRLPASIVSSTPQDLERQMQAQVRRVEALLRRSAREGGVRGRLEVVEGAALETVRSTSSTGDLITITTLRSASTATDALVDALVRNGTHPLLVVRPQQPLPRSLTVLFTPTPEGERALQVAAQVAERLGLAPVTILVLNEANDAPPTAPSTAQQHARQYGLSASVQPLSAFAFSPLAHALRATAPSLLVVPGALLRASLAQRIHTLYALPGPFLITP